LLSDEFYIAKNSRNSHTNTVGIHLLPPCIDTPSTEHSKSRSDVWGH